MVAYVAILKQLNLTL